MKFSTSALLASTAALVAANGNNTIGTGDRFFLMTESSQPPLKDGLIGIYKKGLGVNVKQDINCTQKPAQTYATLSINNFGGLFLYTPGSPVQAYVDRSPEGKGAIGFTTGVQTPENPNYQRYTFELSEEGNLQFVDGDKRFGLQACPINPDDLSYKDGWTVWLDEFEKPTGAACYPFITKATLKNNIMMCSYAGLTKPCKN